MWFILIVLVGACFLLATVSQTLAPSFDQASLNVNSNSTLTPFDFTVRFRVTRNIEHHEYIAIILPRFTRALTDFTVSTNISFGGVLIGPSHYFHAAWVEGVPHFDDNYSPYLVGELHLQTKGNLTIESQSIIELTVFKENGIGAICGFPSSDVVNASGSFVHPFRPFKIATINPYFSPYNITTEFDNYTYSAANTLLSITPLYKNITHLYNATNYVRNDSYTFDFYTGVGKGCSRMNNCMFQGACDYCYEQCVCFEGYGAKTDLVADGRNVNADCSSSEYSSVCVLCFVYLQCFDLRFVCGDVFDCLWFCAQSEFLCVDVI